MKEQIKHKEESGMTKFEEILSGVPQKIKTLEVDTEKKIFRLNGIDFAEGCDYFEVSCKGGEGFRVRMELNKRIVCANYDFDTKALIGEPKVTTRK